jgi:hypothetical protein
MLNLEETSDGRVHRNMEDAPPAGFLFQSSGAAWLWLLARAWLGGQWLPGGWRAWTDPAETTALRSDLVAGWKATVATPPSGDGAVNTWLQALLQVALERHAEIWLTLLNGGYTYTPGPGAARRRIRRHSRGSWRTRERPGDDGARCA